MNFITMEIKLKKIISIFSVLMISCSLFAQSVSLEQVCSLLSKNSITKGKFTQTKKIVTTKKTREMVSSGNFLLCSEGIVLDNKKPHVTSLIICETYLIKVTSDNQRFVNKTKDNPVYANVASSIKAIFSNDYNKINENFDVVSSGTIEDWELQLMPKDSTISSAIPLIVIKGCKEQLNMLCIGNAEENFTKFIFEDQTYPKELTKDEKTNFLPR